MSTESTGLLDQLNLPEDLKDLSTEALTQLAQEIRDRLLEIGQHCGGHLASNLGVVELTLALHTVFNTPTDKFIWDTSHQTYVHKMLTGRLNQMMSIRKSGGLCGFSNIFESEHDCFGAGHASTSISAALGFASARELTGETYSVVSVFGDAALSGGMAFEALNNVEHLKGNFICILNDNDMSISPPVGSMSAYITKVRTSAPYTQARMQFERIFTQIPRIGVPLKRRIEKLVDRVREFVIDAKVGVIFEEFGFKYLGPIDGHNIPLLVGALKFAKTYPGPIMIHIITTKGKGHQPAEADPVRYHGVSPAPKSATPQPKPKTFTQIFGESIVHLGSQYPQLVVVTPAMKEGSGLNAFADQFPTRFFDVGIAEEHAVTFCAGMAKAGLKPILAIYSTFLQRGYDQVIHDVCLQNLPVIFALDRAGLVGEDGPTHHGVFDYAYLLPIPNMTILAPKDGVELTQMLQWAVHHPGPVSIRYSKSALPAQNGQHGSLFTHGTTEVLKDTRANATDPLSLLIIAVGSMAWPSVEAAETLSQHAHKNCAVLNLRVIKPLDKATLLPYLRRSKHVVVVEEGVIKGGVGHEIASEMQSESLSCEWHFVGVPDAFIEHGSLAEQRNECGLSVSHIVELGQSLI
jgi:1-deoxy-D-xylulose-5-phosphate synthase